MSTTTLIERATTAGRPKGVHLPYTERVLTMKRLRRLLKYRRTPFITEALGEYLRHRVPEIFGPDAPEIHPVLSDIADRVRSELEDGGILPDPDGNGQILQTRERRMAADFAALLVWTSEAYELLPHSIKRSDRTLSISLAREGVAWAGIGRDSVQLGICMMILASRRYRAEGKVREAEQTFLDGLALSDGEDEAGRATVRAALLHQYAQMLYENGRLDESERLVEQGEALLPLIPEPARGETEVGLLLIRGTVANYRQNFQAALTSWQRALALNDPEYNPIRHSALLQSLGLLYDRMEHIEKGLQFLLQAVALLEANGVAATGAWVYVNAAALYEKLGEFGRGHEMLDRIGRIVGLDPQAPPEQPEQFAINFHIARADLLLAEERREEARPLLEWAIVKSRDIGFHSSQVAACALSASLHGRSNRFEEACRYLEQAIGVSGASSRFNQFRLKIQLAQWRIRNGDLREATGLLDEVEPELTEILPLQIRLLRCRAELAETEGNPLEALAFERQANDVERKLSENNRKQSVRFARIIAETDLLEQVVEQQRQQERRLEHELAEAIVRLGEKERMIAGIERRAVEELQRVGKKGGEEGAFPRFILSTIGSDTDRTELSLRYLADAGEDFIRRLRLSAPELTPRQERLCVLLRAGLNAKEICALMEIGSEGLKAHRKRVRKVLGLKAGENLENRIAEI